jgi:hypothetical protein
MREERDTWIPLSQATARMWALEAMAETRPPRRRMMPALRRAAAALAASLRRRSHIAPGARAAACAPARIAPDSTD